MTHKYKRPPQDKQAGLYGKVDNDFNKIGNERPTQKNEGLRTPHSRSDRDDHIGNNQTLVRKGAPNSGIAGTPRGKQR